MTELPIGWASESLSDICLPVTKADPVSTGRQQVRYVDIGSVDGGRHRLPEIPWVNSESAPSRCRQVIASGDTVFSTVRPYLEKIAFIDNGLDGEFASTGFCVLRPGPKVLPRYLFQFSVSRQMLNQVLIHQRGVSYPAVLDKNVRATTIPLPPLDEQRRIVDILDGHLSRLDAGGRSLVRTLRRVSTLRASIINHAARGSLDGAEAGQDGLGRGWAWVSPAAVSDDHKGIVIGPFGSNLKTSDYRSDGVPLVFVRNVRQAYFGPVGRRYVSLDKAAELSSHEVLPGDIVITKMGDPPGDAAVYDAAEPGIVTADVIRLRPGSGQSSDYLALAINSSTVARQISQITRGVAQKKVSLARFRAEMRIPVPDYETQLRVSQRVADLTSGLDRIVLQSETAQVRGLSLRQSLLAAAFSGRLTGKSIDVEIVEEMADV